MRTLRALAVCVFTLAGVALPCAAQAQMESREAIDLQNQIAELRQELQMMQQAQQSGSQTPPSYAPQPVAPYPSQGGAPQGGSDVAAELVVRVSALEEQMRDLQGKVDDLNNQLQRQHDDLTKQIGDLQFKLGQGGAPAGGNPPGDQLTPDAPESAPRLAPPEKPAAPPPPPHRTAENALHEGNAALARRDYAAAAAAAREVLASHSVRSTDAQFLLARAESGEHKYREAAADYYLAYNREPKASAAPVALLGVANALIDMNDKADACQALAKLGAEFPKMSPTLHAAEVSARKRAACR